MEIRQSSIIQDSRRKIAPILLFITLTLCFASFASRDVSAQDWSLDEIIPGRWENQDINDVYFIGNQGWAVGENGIIIHTQDGVRWHPQLSGFENDDLHGVYFHDASVGWIVGEDGVVLRTEDGGITWRQRTNSGFDLYDIWFADDRYGWAVGESGRIIYTTNGGVTWKMDRVGTRTLYAAYFLNSINGWVIGAGGNIYSWNGSSWSGHQSNTNRNLYGIYFTSPTNGWIVGEQGTILHTSDATFWSPWENHASANSNDLHSVYFPKSQWDYGWIAGDNGTIMRTSDAGNNWWKYDNSPTSKALKAIGSPDLNEIWIVGDNGTIVQSENRGQLWSEFTNPPYDSFRDVSFDVKLVNSKLDYRGWIVGDGGVILKMEEDGSGWREHPTPTNRNLYSISMFTKYEGWAVGSGGTILRFDTTTQEITRWHLENSITEQDLHGIYFVNSGNGWAVGDSGEILYCNSGTWGFQNSYTSENLNGVYFIDENEGWVVGNLGTILHTTNGGLTWGTIVSNTTRHLRGVHFVDSDNGWIVGDNGFILYWHDGILTEQNTSPSIVLYDVDFVDKNRGWISASDRMAVSTPNSGDRWDLHQINFAFDDIYGIDFVDWSSGVAVGEGETILRYKRIAPLVEVSLIAPQGEITTLTPTFIWESTKPNLVHNIYIDDDDEPFQQPISVISVSGSTSLELDVAIAPDTYYWGIELDDGTRSFPEFLQFTAQGPTDLVPISPSGYISDATPTFQWTSSNQDLSDLGLIEYTLFIDDDETPFDGGISIPVGANLSYTLLSTDPWPTLSEGKHSWGVRTSGLEVVESGILVFIVDLSPPTGTIVINDGSNSTNALMVNITLSASDTVLPDGDPGSGVAEMQLSNDGLTWSAPEPFTGAQITKEWGLPQFGGNSMDGEKIVYVRYRDVLGHWMVTPVGDIIELDTVPPSGTITINDGAEFTGPGDVTITLSATDDRSGFEPGGKMVLSNDGVTWTPEASYQASRTWDLTLEAYGGNDNEGVKTVYVMYADAAGNWMTQSVSDSIILDKTAPTGTVVINDGAELTNSPLVYLALSASDANGVVSMQFSNGGNIWSPWEDYDVQRQNWDLSQYGGSSEDGVKTLYARFMDAVGNVTAPSASDSIELKSAVSVSVQIYAPEIEGKIRDNDTVSVEGDSEPGLAEVTKELLDENNSPINIDLTGVIYDSGTGNITGSFNVGELTAETIKLKIGVKDALGNTSEAASGMLTVDNDPPTDINVSINQGELIMSRSISITISATDAAEMFVDGDIEGQKTWIAYAESLGIELTEGDGTKQVTVQFRDDMRNESGVASDQTLLDTTPPTGSIVINDGDEISISLKVSLTLSAADDNGVESYQLRNDGGPWTNPAPYPDQDVQWDLSQDGNTTEGLRTVEVKYRDKVGNWGEIYSDSILVDSTAPVIKAWTIDDKQEAMEAVVVRAVISGDRAITEANLHYGKKGTSQYTTVPMVKVPGPGDQYTAEIPGMDVTLDGVEYYFSASDGLWTSRLPAEGSIVNVFSFTVVDKTNPTIEHDPITKISVNFSPEIVAIVSDAVGLKRVNLFYKPESDWGFTEVDMVATATPDEYTASIPAQFYLSVVYYYIEAEDVSGNVRTSPSRGASQPNTIAFVDTESPVIAHTNIEDGQEAGDPVVIGAQITDNMDVAEALLEYRVAGKVGSIVVAMTPVSTYYSAEIPGEFTMPGIIEYTITASDGSPQSNDVEVSHSFTVVDTTPPDIQLAFVPSEVEVHKDITIKADVTDNVRVESVILNYKGVTDTTWKELVMKAVGTAYSAIIPAQGQPGVVQFYVYAVDPYGVWSTSPALDPQNSPLLIDIIDVIDPVIEHSPVVGMQEAGIPVTISATVTDNVEVVDVSLHYRTAGQNSYKIASMLETGAASVYSGIIPGLEVVPPGAEYFIEAMDESANITTHYAAGTLPHSFIVVDTVPPAIVYDPAPLETVLTTDIIVVTLKATDTVGIKEIKVFYRGEAETEYNVLICNKIGDDRYSNTIPTPLAEGMVYYYIQAEDNSGNMSTSPAVDPKTQPHSIFVDDDSPPASPTRLVANSAPNGVIMLTWESSISPDVGRYNIYTDSGGGIVDYSNVYDFVDSSVETWESPSLGEGIYIFVVRAMDKSGNEEKNTNSRSAEADATKPQPVTGLSAKSRPGGRILLEWGLSTSGDSAAYNIYSDNAQVSIDYSTPVARINDPGKSWTSEVLRDGLLYRFVVRCQDRAGNEEESVNFVSARADATPPSGVTQLNSSTHIVNRWSNVPRVTVNWNHSEDTGTGLAGYSVVWDTSERTIPDTTIDMSATVSPQSTFDANAQYPSSSNQYYFHIRPADNAENWSQETIHFGPILIDTEMPNPPTGLLAVPLAGGKISLSWTASSSSDVVEYSIYWDEGTGSGIDYTSALATVSATEWTSVTLGNGINYQFGVRAEDQAGNEEKNTQTASSVSDSEPPIIVHEPIAGMLEQEIVSVMIEAVVTDASPLERVELHYRKRGESSYKDVAMTAGVNNSRKAEIPSSAFTSAGVDYYISASDQAGNVSTHPVLTITVSSTLEIPVSASGDEISIGYSTSLTFPAGAVSSGTILSVSVPRAAPAPQAGLGKHIITRELRLNTELGKSINFTLRYSDAEAAGEDESSLGLYLWDGQQWDFLAVVNPQLNEASITTMKLGIFSIIGDTEPPSVGELQPSVYSEPDTPITARIEDSGSGIDPQGIEIMLNGQNYNVPGTALRGQAFSFTLPEDHKPGNYSLQLTVKDNVGNLTVRNSTFQVEGELALKNVYCFPNPFRPAGGVHFAYTLTEAVNKVTIRIFGMDGKLVYRIEDASALLGENLVEWNCEDEAGDLVLSSVYICHIEAEGPEETADKTIKIAGWQ